jgi:hypothetical protein
MAKSTKIPDVYISHSINDVPLADAIAKSCRAAGLEATSNAESTSEASVGDATWEALVESNALLAILSASALTPNMLVELGAAWAWNKPIFAVVTEASAPIPAALTDVPVYPAAAIEDVIRAIKQATQRLSEKDHVLLAKIYGEIGVPVDQLTLDPSFVTKLSKRFSKGAGKAIQGEVLLAELFRMRKRGELPQLRSTSHARARLTRGTA